MVIDIILLISVAWGFYIGFARGIIKTVFTVVSILFGVIAAIKFSPAATRFLETAFNTQEPLMWVAGILLSFVLTMMLIRLFARTLEGLLESVNINIINQIAGGVLFASLMTLLYSILLWFGVRSHLVSAPTLEESRTYVYLEHFPGKMRQAYDYVLPSVKQFWDGSVEFMDRLEEDLEMERTESDPVIRDLPDEES